jgi:hypothetical protein
MLELKYTSVCGNNGLIIFDSIPACELQTGRRLYTDVSDFSRQIDRDGYCTRFEVRSRQMLVAALQAVLIECRAGVLRPALHFECHGDASRGLHIPDSNEYVTWTELVDFVAQINQATRNNTALVLAACHGFEASKIVSFASACPYNFLIAPNAEVTAGFFADSMLPFYKELATTGDLSSALRHLDESMQLFVSGQWFYSTLATFMIQHGWGKAKRELAEEIVTKRLASAPYKNRELMQRIRAETKSLLRSPKGFFTHSARTFLHGKSPVPFDDFQAFVQGHRPS